MSIDKSRILEAAQQYTIRGQIQKAIDEWKKLLTDTPNDANIFNTIGDLCLKYQTTDRGKEEAISHYVKAAEIFESSGFALKAIAVYKKVLKIAPSHKDIYLRLGKLNCERGLIGNAREDYLLAAKLYTQEGQVREALDVYRKIADLDPSNLSVRLKIADIFLKEGLNNEAIEEYNKVASVQIEAGRMEEAEKLYKLILRINPDDTEAIIKIGKFRLEDGYFDEAIAYVKKALDHSPDSEEAFSILIDSYNKAKRYDTAEEIIKSRINDYPEEIKYREILASILLNKGDSQGAADEYLSLSKEYLNINNVEKAFSFAQRTIDIAPELIPAHEMMFDLSFTLGKKDFVEDKGLFLARHYYDIGDNAKAGDYYQKILQTNPYSIESKEGLARIDHIKAEEIQPSEVVLEPVNVSAQLASAEAYLKYGLIEKAITELKSAITLDQHNIIAHARLKDAYHTAGDQDKAIEECLFLLKIYESEGDTDSIAELIREAVEINPNDRRIKEYRDRLRQPVSEDIGELFEEAGFYSQQGMIDEAVSVYEKILQISPGNKEAISRLKDIKGSKEHIVLPEVEVIRDEEEPAVSFFDLGEVLKETPLEEPVKKFVREEEPIVKSFDDLFHEFQEGIRSQLSSEDYETHYNLGIAYKEMGLYQEAIEEFRLCMPGEQRFIDASFMVALCYKELGEYSQAAEALKQATASNQFNAQRHLVVKYELGELLELLGKKEDALSVFTEIHDTDATFRDVSEKVLSLQKGA